MMRTAKWVIAVAACLSALRVEAQPLVLQDFGTLKNLGQRAGEEYSLPGSGHLGGPDDRRLGTSYVDDTNHIVVRVTVETFSNRAWLGHELERRYRTLRGAERFSDGVTIREEPGRRRFDLVTSVTARLIAPAVP